MNFYFFINQVLHRIIQSNRFYFANSWVLSESDGSLLYYSTSTTQSGVSKFCRCTQLNMSLFVQSVFLSFDLPAWNILYILADQFFVFLLVVDLVIVPDLLPFFDLVLKFWYLFYTPRKSSYCLLYLFIGPAATVFRLLIHLKFVFLMFGWECLQKKIYTDL